MYHILRKRGNFSIRYLIREKGGKCVVFSDNYRCLVRLAAHEKTY